MPVEVKSNVKINSKLEIAPGSCFSKSCHSEEELVPLMII